MKVKFENSFNNDPEDESVRKALIRSNGGSGAVNDGSLIEQVQDDQLAPSKHDPRKVHELDPDNFFKLGKFRI